MEMKFRAHDTFFIRKGWLTKGMKHVQNKPSVFVDKQENPMDVIGLGSNMVKALRYWLQAVGLTQEPSYGRRDQSFTELGQLVFKFDPFVEELGTLQLLQYELASNKNEATAWYFFFNKFSFKEFTQEDFVNEIQNYISMNQSDSKKEKSVALRSLNDDFSCIINTYIPRYKTNPGKVHPENNIDCPFGELGLVDILNRRKRIYKKSIPAADSFDPWIILGIIVDCAGDKKEIPLDELLHSERNIGKIFNLDAITMLEILRNVEKTGEIKIQRTAGMDVIHIINEHTFSQCVCRFYNSLQ